MSENLKDRLISIFQDLADTVSSKPRELGEIIDAMLADIRELKTFYTEKEIVDVAAQIAGSDSLELYWLARAGIQSVKKLLVEGLESEDSCQTMWAAIGLVYLNSNEGMEKLEKLALLSTKDDAELTLEEIYEEISTSKLVELVKFRNKIDSGEYGAISSK
ncbi:hypothetical protein [Zooshikella sp. RANM57]|uniref:hypothetical protein n=1 Tax=Zooshikella sp. RANM57 TaxID=3425863 RepID=UPI003D6FB7B1